MNFNDLLHTVKASTTNSTRSTSPLDCQAIITHREIWTRAPRAAAKKATADGVNAIALDETAGRFYIFQVSGYTPERGLYCDLLDETGRTVESY